MYKTTQQVKKGFREMSARMNQSDGHDRMNDSANGRQTSSQKAQSHNDSSTETVGEYIDFEEIK